MPSQRSPRYPLRSQDVLISPDLLSCHKSSVPSQSRILDGNPQIIMPSLVDPAVHTVSGFYHNEKPLFGDVSFVDHKDFLEWQALHDTAVLLQDPNQDGSVSNYPDSRFENVIGNSTPDHLVEQTMWDYAAYNPPVQPYSSSTYLRSLSCGDDIPAQDSTATAPARQARTRPSYAAEPEHQKFPSSNLAQQRRFKLPLTNPRRGMPPPDLGGKSQQSWCAEPKLSTFPTTKLGGLTIPGTDMDKGCEDGVSLVNTNEGESDADASENAEPYAQLIYRALRDAPGYGMVLKDIYDWFEKNTDKAKNPSSKGWQNSIRHNLSMNGAFKKVERTPITEESKKGYIWVLEQSALEEGVKSTTRYRKHNFNKKICKPESPAPQRQRSGAKGGKAARKTAKVRRFTRSDEPKTFRCRGALLSTTHPDAIEEEPAPRTPNKNFFPSGGMPYYLHRSNALQTPTSRYAPSFNRPNSPMSPLISNTTPYEFASITACGSAAPEDPLFYEVLG